MVDTSSFNEDTNIMTPLKRTPDTKNIDVILTLRLDSFA